MHTFKHSGHIEELIYSLPIIKHFGGGKLFIHLNQMEWLIQNYYGREAPPEIKNKVDVGEYGELVELLTGQEYITSVEAFSNQEISHNLDRFRTAFLHWKGNFVDCYASCFPVPDEKMQELRNTPWLKIAPKKFEDKTVVVSRSAVKKPELTAPHWAQWKAERLDKKAFFLGSKEDYINFVNEFGWDLPLVEPKNLLEKARYIAGATTFIGSTGVELALANAIGVEVFWEKSHPALLQQQPWLFKDRTNSTPIYENRPEVLNAINVFPGKPKSKYMVVSMNDENYQRLADLTWNKNKKLYCERHGYAGHNKTTGFSKDIPIGFEKIFLLLNLMKDNPECEWFWWTGSDAMITNFSTKIEDKIDEKYDMIIATDCNGLNADSILLKNSEWSRNYMQHIIDSIPKYINHYFHEQQAMIESYLKFPNNIKVVPQRYMNAYLNQLYPHQSVFDKLGTDGTWQKGDWFVHWPGTNLELRLQLAQMFMNEIVQ